MNQDCFVIQQFDDEFLEHLFHLVIAPAIKDSGFEPKRADKILGATPPLTKISDAIKSSAVCIAEITPENANVFVEIGWAMALKKPFFILWDKSKRQVLPFDVSHQAGIPYDSSKANWEIELKTKLTNNLQHEFSTKPTNAEIINDSESILSEELSDLETTFLAVLLDAESNNQEIGVTKMPILLDTLGYGKTKVTLSASKLIKMKFVDRHNNMQGDQVCAYYLTTAGKELISHIEKIDSILGRLNVDYSQFSPESAWRF